MRGRGRVRATAARQPDCSATAPSSSRSSPSPIRVRCARAAAASCRRREPGLPAITAPRGNRTQRTRRAARRIGVNLRAVTGVERLKPCGLAGGAGARSERSERSKTARNRQRSQGHGALAVTRFPPSLPQPLPAACRWNLVARRKPRHGVNHAFQRGRNCRGGADSSDRSRLGSEFVFAHANGGLLAR